MRFRKIYAKNFRYKPIFAAAAIAATMLSCTPRQDRAEGALYSCDDFTVWGDSISCRTINTDGREGTFTLSPKRYETPADRPSLTSPDTLLSYLFNLPLSPEERTDPLIDPNGASKRCAMLLDSLDSRSGSGEMFFPVTSSRSEKLAECVAIVNSTGNERLHKRLTRACMRVVGEDREWSFDDSLFLFRGIDPTTLSVHNYPDWMEAADFASSMTLATNINHAVMLRFLGEDETADSLVNSIDTYLWQPDLGRYGSMLYCSPVPIALTTADLRAMGFGVESGIIAPPIDRTLVESTPILKDRVPSTWPLTGKADPDPMTTNAKWAIASARVANDNSFRAALSMLAALWITRHDHETASAEFQSAIVRGMFGLDTSKGDELRFRPFVPKCMDGKRTLSAIRYHDAVLTITLSGTGNIISTFSVDGTPQAKHSVDATMTGEHEIDITLVGSDAKDSELLTAQREVTPAAPTPEWVSPTKATGLRKPAKVFVDGVFIEKTDRIQYEISDEAATTIVTFATVEESLTGYASRPHLYASDSLSIKFSDFAHPYARSLKDKRLAQSYVESTRYRNRNIRFSVTAPNGGDYYVRFKYLNGEGIVNPDRKYSVRTLSVNSTAPKIVVFPQLSPDHWRHDRDWQTSTGVTPPILIRLNKGENSVSLNYFGLNIKGFNHDANTLIPITATFYPVTTHHN